MAAYQSPAQAKLLKYALFVLAGLLLLTAGAVGGFWFWYGKLKYQKYSLKQPQTQGEELPTLTPIPPAEEQTHPALIPEKVTEDFYTWYLECLDKHFQSESGKSPRENCPWEESEYVSEKLLEATKNVQDSDPILCAQDTPNGFTVGKAEISKNQAIVALTEEWSGPPRQLTNIKVELRLINNQWKITNITCPTP